MKTFRQYLKEFAVKDYRKTTAYIALSKISDEVDKPGMQYDIEIDGDPSIIKKAMEKHKPTSVKLGRNRDVYTFSDSTVYVDKQRNNVNLIYYETV